MSSLPSLIVAFSLGFIFALILIKIRNRRAAAAEVDMADVDPPLHPDEYAKGLEKLNVGYLEAMAQYDRLVPWAAGGALVVSLTFVSSFSPLAPPWSRWILAVAWLALGGSLLSSIFSQYSSTRIKVWSKNYLQSRQKPPSSSEESSVADEWKRVALEYKRKAQSSARHTKLLNVLAGVLLIVGLLAMGAFAIFAVPFGAGPAQ